MALPADNPIRSSDHDLLGRTEPARAFARQLLSLDASEGLVVAVLGPWGSGKTSFVNLARDELGTRADVLDFNPWMFSGAEQLVQSFFVEIAAQLQVASRTSRARRRPAELRRGPVGSRMASAYRAMD